jgi:hypothetical protein
MDINVNVKLSADASFIEALRTLFSAMTAASPAHANVTTKKKAEKSAADTSNTVVDSTGAISYTDTTAEGATETITESKVTTIKVEEVRAAVHAKKEELGGNAKIKTLLTEFGAESVTALETAKYSDFLSKLNELSK